MLAFDIRRLNDEDRKLIELRVFQEFQHMLLFRKQAYSKKNVLKNPLHEYVKFES